MSWRHLVLLAMQVKEQGGTVQVREAVLEAEAGQGSCRGQPWGLSTQDSEQAVGTAVALIPGKRLR